MFLEVDQSMRLIQIVIYRNSTLIISKEATALHYFQEKWQIAFSVNENRQKRNLT